MDKAEAGLDARRSEKKRKAARSVSMSEKRIENFEEFWPFYVGEHSLKATRLFHFVGSTAGASTAIAGLLLRKPSLIGLGLVLGYGPAWFSHFFIEKNRPASFKYPAWSFAADWVMWSKILQGTMDEEVERVMARAAEARATEARATEAPTTEAPAAAAKTNGSSQHAHLGVNGVS